MSHHKQSRQHSSRTATWILLVLVPALAIVGLGTTLSLTTGGPDTPSGLQVAETREFAAVGDAVTATTQAADPATVADFADTWQNTVRKPPSPRR
ncbi:MAG TPA: hypothetical protein VH120_08545 [Gemmataceae bacterium]|jgi:hypothetical protein|nr:hypothetical protein [Gemmataceae bacterium]